MSVVCLQVQGEVKKYGTWLGLASRDKDVREIRLRSSNQMDGVGNGPWVDKEE